MKHRDILGILKDGFQTMDSTGINEDYQKKSVWYNHTAILTMYRPSPGILHKASAFESKQLHQSLCVFH